MRLKAQGDSIETGVTRATIDTVNPIATINVNLLTEKRDNIITIESDIQAQRKLFDRAYKNGMLRSDSLRRAMQTLIHHEVSVHLGPYDDDRALYQRGVEDRLHSLEQKVMILESEMKGIPHAVG
jgi:hypothetical protein